MVHIWELMLPLVLVADDLHVAGARLQTRLVAAKDEMRRHLAEAFPCRCASQIPLTQKIQRGLERLVPPGGGCGVGGVGVGVGVSVV